jgi:hypothetical protein
MAKFIALTGQRFGRLIAMWPCGRNAKGIYWLCVCDLCGSYAPVRADNLKSGHTQSCGCRHDKHGHARTRRGGGSPMYRSWQNMLARCQNPNRASYRDYGAKGVKVCDRWQTFSNFLADMGERPEGATLGRILDRGDYEPGNAFWMTRPEQSLAKKNNNALRRWEEFRATVRKPPVSADQEQHTAIA